MNNLARQKSLRFLVLLLVSVTFTIFAGILFALFHLTMPKVLLEAENSYHLQQQKVVAGLLNAALRDSYLLTEDTAYWNETDAFVRGTNPEYMERNWSDTSLLQSFRKNYAIFLNVRGEVVYSDFYDYLGARDMDEPEGLLGAISKVAVDVLRKQSGKSGIITHDGRAYSVSAAPISNQDSDEISGVLVLGCIMNNAYFRDITQYDSFFRIIGQIDISDLGKSAIRLASNDVVTTELPLSDLYGKPMMLRISDSRRIFEEGSQILYVSAVLLLGVLLLFGVLFYFILHRFLLRPMERLSKDISAVGETDSLLAEKYSKTREFQVLCESINDMLFRLSQSRISLDVFKNILDGMDASIYVTDPETDEVLFVNGNMLKEYGVTEDPTGKPCWSMLPGSFDKRCPHCPKPQLLKDPDSVVVWEEHNQTNGSVYRNTDCLIKWPGRNYMHMQCSVNITQIKLAEETLALRLRQQELMSDMSQIFMSPGDTSDLIRQALEMAGTFMQADRILVTTHKDGSSFLEMAYEWNRGEGPDIAPEDRMIPFAEGNIEYDMLIGKRESCMSCDDISQVPGHDIAIRHGIKSYAAAPLYAAGHFGGILSVSQLDETRVWTQSEIELVKLIANLISSAMARGAMEKNLHRMSSIANSSPQYISYINKHGQFEYFNQGAIDTTGYSAEELRAKGVALLFDEKTYRRVRGELIPEILMTGRGTFELPVIRKDGEVLTMSISAFTVGQEGADLGIGTIAADMTEQRKLEKELIAARDQAEQSSQAKGEFLSRMSHEMRTPMNAIIGMTSIAKGSPAPEKKEYCLDKIEEASKHLLGVINDILDMSKIEANKFELSYSEFSFEKMIMRVINVVNFRIDEKKQRFSVKTDNRIPHFIISDEQRLAQVIANLLSNAVKFTPEQGSVTLSAKLVKAEDNVCTLRIAVEDTGIGIARDQQRKLFTSFEQADGGIARKFGGTGLGLAISKRIVDMMGGSIWVESEPDKGSAFIFEIPVRKGDSSHDALMAPEIDWPSLRVLAVDDSEAVREFFTSFANSIGLHCDVAEDGFQACEMIRNCGEHPYNIAFVDWKMPGMDGIELAGKIRNELAPEMVLIMISAVEWTDIEAKARQAGVDKFVPKPLFASTLVNSINECLSLAQYQNKTNGKGAADGQAAPDTVAGLFAPGVFKNFHILLAEDIAINSEIAITLLEDTGVKIDWAQNGLEAYQMFRDNQSTYDLVLMDIHMPEVDGYEATRRIRNIGSRKAMNVPIVAMTANVFREDIERCLAAGMNDHIGKPIDMDEIITKLGKYLLKQDNHE
ncbi:response regulator [Desulfovibrio sp. OttesenSCG-928-C06]|nr:response regulator [Desulfovibrio sp. OttesenSCG-928-C06]